MCTARPVFIKHAEKYCHIGLGWALAMALCLSITCQCSIETAEMAFGTGDSFDLSYTVFKVNVGISKSKQYFPLKLRAKLWT